MRFCHLSNHLRSECECGCGGCECVHQWDHVGEATMPVFANVPGGSKDTPAYRFHRDFDKDLYAYEKAVGEGLQPDKSTLGGVKSAQERVRSHKRGLDKLKKMGADTEGLKVAPGVER